MSKQRRSLRAYLVEPFKQVRFGLHVVAVCLVYVVALGALFARAFNEQYEQLVELFGVADSSALLDNTVFVKNALIMGGVLVAFVATMLFVVIRRTHKMYGPMISTNRFLEEIKKGNYAARLKIREKDDFQDLVTKLNEVATILHARHGVVTAAPALADEEHKCEPQQKAS